MSKNQQMDIVEKIKQFDDYLYKNNQTFTAIVIGGAAFNLLKIVDRLTRDVDIILPSEMPKNIRQLADEFAKENKIEPDWINVGPTSVMAYLPNGWESRTRVAFEGKCITFKTLGRLELLMTKCWAMMDRRSDLPDILAMKPTTYELIQVKEWLKPLDGNPDWPRYVDLKITELDSEVKKQSKDKGIGF